jgi:DNA-binding NarL/FixJ family response regulator
MPTRLKCLILEDQLLIQQLLALVLKEDPGIEIVATPQSVAEGVKACRKHRPDLLLLDLALPDGSGLKVARSLIRINRDARIIIVSGETSTFVCPDDLAPHIQAIVRKEQAYDDLISAIGDAVALRSSHTTPLLHAAFPSFEEKLKKLSAKEREVFDLIGSGIQSKEIASLMGISYHTVQGHRKAISIKLDMVGNELAVMAIRHHSR